MPIFKIIYNIFFVMVGIIAILLVISIFPITGNYKVLIVQSGSMQPALKTGSLIVARPMSEYAVGAIVTYKYGQDLITHRIVEKKMVNNRVSYVTKGDGNKASDKNDITAKDIAGQVFLTVPYLGYAVDTAKKPWGFALIVVLPALIIIFDEVKKIWQEIKKIRARKKNKQI